MQTTAFFLFKVALSGFLVALISTLAKKFPQWAALLTALPLITFLSLIWIYLETKDYALLANYSRDVLIWTLPGLIFFIILIFLFRAQVNFFLSLGAATASLGLVAYLCVKFHLIRL